LTVSAPRSTEFKLILKESSIKTVKINAVSINLQKENGYVNIERVFNDGDKIEIEINTPLHLIELNGCEDIAAIMYGKVLLAQIGQIQYSGEVSKENINKKLIKSHNQQLSFTMADMEGNCVEFLPLFRVEDEVYTVYISLKDNIIPNRKTSVAKDGSGAYK